MNEEGKKYDQGKTRWDTVPWKALMQVAEVMTHGANKYGDQNWRRVEIHRYFAAAMRHISAWRMGEITDAESGKPHLAHAACCLLIMMAKGTRASDQIVPTAPPPPPAIPTPGTYRIEEGPGHD